MKKLILVLFLIFTSYAFDIERLPDCDQKIVIEAIVIRNNGVVRPLLREYIIKKWGMAPFYDEISADSMRIDTVASLN